MATLFRENGIEHDKVNYFNERFTAEKIRSLANKMGMRPFEMLRKGEAAVKSGEITQDTPDEAVIDAMVADPALIQRPIVEVGDRAVMARPIEKALEIL